MGDLVNLLFETKALRICPENKPFWYTSGKIGPYYINTHFLYGSEEKANSLLKLIDESKESVLTCPKAVFEAILENYNQDRIFKEVMDIVIQYIKDNLDITEISYISGGERRDWFFSMLASYFLKLPHITIYKDLTTVVSDSDFNETKSVSDIEGAKVLHIADLITEASSYERAWIPAIENLNGKIISSISLVDRLQGGQELLNSKGINSYSLVNIDEDLFDKALEIRAIGKEQYDMVVDFIHDPDGAMKEFIGSHPEFMTDALNSDDKTIARAKLCLEKGFYN